MPKGLIKTPREKRLWEKAKGIAEEAGQKENWAYTMGVFKRMLPDRFEKSAVSVAARYLQAYDEKGRSPTGWGHGVVEPWKGTDGIGSQVPPVRDNQGQPLAPPDLGIMDIPGYEWHNKSKDFHQVVQKQASGERMLGIDIRSWNDRGQSWWTDLAALFIEYWSAQNINLESSPNKIIFKVEQFGTWNVLVRGSPENLSVYVNGRGKKFGSMDSLWSILMWIDSVTRG